MTKFPLEAAQLPSLGVGIDGHHYTRRGCMSATARATLCALMKIFRMICYLAYRGSICGHSNRCDVACQLARSPNFYCCNTDAWLLTMRSLFSLFSLTIVPSVQRDHCMRSVATVRNENRSGCSYYVPCSGRVR